jgi:hypothetical protein
MIEYAINKALDFLLTTRSPDGFWRDFWTPAGMSDAWVTGYVGAVLALHLYRKAPLPPLKSGLSSGPIALSMKDGDMVRECQ